VRPHFLLVEDEEGMGKTLKKVLEQWVGVTWVRNYAEAVTAFSKETFSALITDVRLDGPSGFVVLEEFRKRQPRTAAMVLTAYFAEADTVRACELGAQYVAKPITTAGLATFVDGATAGTGAGEAELQWVSLSRATYDYVHRVVAASASRRAAARALGIAPRSLRRMLLKHPPAG
jgi:ActR/RegA family two-component response regulator